MKNPKGKQQSCETLRGQSVRGSKGKAASLRNASRTAQRPLFKIDLSTINAGLSHQTCNFQLLIRYCFKNNLKLVKPLFKLTGLHNNGHLLVTDLSEYYDLDDITVDGKRFDLVGDNMQINYTIERKSYQDDLLANNPIFYHVPDVPVVIPYRPEIVDLGRQIANLLDDYICIHVRRGDRITNDQIDQATQPDNIKSVLDRYDICLNVYIMTNKVDQLQDLPNMTNRKIHFYTNFKRLRDIKDNYYLFCVENVIMQSAKIRCSTFNTPLKSYYHCSLSSQHGWQ